MTVAALIYTCPEAAFSAYMALEGLCDVVILQPGNHPEQCVKADVVFVDAAALSAPGVSRLMGCFPKENTRWCVLTSPERPMVSVGNMPTHNFATECGPLTSSMASSYLPALSQSLMT